MSSAPQFWSTLRASFWFAPALIVLASMTAGVVLVEVDAWHSVDLARWSPRVFGAGADGSRAMLSAIATSMVTVAGVVFSITIVTLSLTATQYSPRVLRNFMRDTPTQVVLGVFVGVFAYCLVVLRTIRGGDEGAFIPSLAVLAGMVYAFGGIATLIFFIHHVATSIQASSILQRIAADTVIAIDHLFPQELGTHREDPGGVPVLPDRWQLAHARRSGYVRGVDADALLVLARETKRVLRVVVPVGEFVAEGAPVAAASGEEPLEDNALRRLRASVVVGSHRTVEQDAAFGLQQLVDVALRALSAGINDPVTACMCVDQIGSLLARLARRRLPEALRFEDGELRVIAPPPEFEELLSLALDPLVRHSRGDVQVLARVFAAIRAVAAETDESDRRQALARRLHVLRIETAVVRPRARLAGLRRQAAALERHLRFGSIDGDGALRDG